MRHSLPRPPQPAAGEEHWAAVDLHGLTVEEAEVRLFETLDALPADVQMVEVAHGYHRGTAIKKMVRDEFHHWRIVRKQASLNAGVTIFVLK